jgi:Zn-dependent M28 family amino/carboxypeptidase
VIIFNEGQEGRTDVINGTLSPPQAAIPAVGSSFAVGEQIYGLLQSGPVTAHLAVSAQVQLKDTENIIADSPTGRTDRTVVAGAHLDSVLEGPGIEDNGSGSAVILEIALQMAALDVEPVNALRFTFWGAEESGLLGSQHYVDSLTKAQRKNIALYMNYDMVASPNYVRFVYDGDGSAFGIKGPTGSARIEQVFTDYFGSQHLASEPTAFDGRSDYDAFIGVGIPAGGLFTGAEGAKTAAQAAVYGGVAGASYDPCYHQSCDSLTPVEDGADAALYAALNAEYDLVGNINMEAQEEMADAAAHATLTFALSTSAVSGTDRAESTSTSLYKGSHVQR